jgi:hypothetical protein
MEESQKVISVLSVVVVSLAHKHSVNFMETISLLGQREAEQLGVIFNCFAVLAI